MKFSRGEKQNMIDYVNDKLEMLSINNSYPAEEKILAGILICIMEAKIE